MSGMEYSDFMEAEAQGAYRGHGTMVQVYWEIQYIGGRKEDASSLQDAIKAVAKRTGIAREALTVVEIERDLVEVYPKNCKWIGAVATIMELQAEVDL